PVGLTLTRYADLGGRVCGALSLRGCDPSFASPPRGGRAASTGRPGLPQPRPAGPPAPPPGPTDAARCVPAPVACPARCRAPATSRRPSSAAGPPAAAAPRWSTGPAPLRTAAPPRSGTTRDLARTPPTHDVTAASLPPGAR